MLLAPLANIWSLLNFSDADHMGVRNHPSKLTGNQEPSSGFQHHCHPEA